MANPTGKYVTIVRTFDAPRELVWKMWTDPEMMKKWWGPRIFTAPVVQIDLQVGGKFIGCMEDKSGNRIWSTGTYKEIVPFEKLVITDSFSDEHGNPVPASHYGIKEPFPLELQVTVTFEEIDGKTKMTLRHGDVSSLSEQMLQGMDQGWNESFDKLAENVQK